MPQQRAIHPALNLASQRFLLRGDEVDISDTGQAMRHGVAACFGAAMRSVIQPRTGTAEGNAFAFARSMLPAALTEDQDSRRQ